MEITPLFAEFLKAIGKQVLTHQAKQFFKKDVQTKLDILYNTSLETAIDELPLKYNNAESIVTFCHILKRQILPTKDYDNVFLESLSQQYDISIAQQHTKTDIWPIVATAILDKLEVEGVFAAADEHRVAKMAAILELFEKKVKNGIANEETLKT